MKGNYGRKLFCSVISKMLPRPTSASNVAIFAIMQHERKKTPQKWGSDIFLFHFLIRWASFPCVYGGVFNWKWKFLYLSPDYHSRWRAIKINELWCASVRLLQNAGSVSAHIYTHLRLKSSYRWFHFTFGLHSEESGGKLTPVRACCACARLRLCVLG